jgi:hypothetical protein
MPIGTPTGSKMRKFGDDIFYGRGLFRVTTPNTLKGKDHANGDRSRCFSLLLMTTQFCGRG